MEAKQNLFDNTQFTGMAIFISAVIVIFVAINVFATGGEDVVLTVNSYANSLFSSFAAVIAIWIWGYTSDKDTSKRIWAGIALGLALWAIADTISAIYPLLLDQEIPDLSMADLFWLAGYIPLAVALVWRSQSFGVNPTKMELRTAIGLVLLVVLVSGYFVVWPAIQSSDPGEFWISLVNVLYPIGDVLIAIDSLFILFTLGGGSFSSMWRIIAVGLMLRSFGDLMYNYAAGNDMYWPDNHITLASILTDIPYSTSYLAIALGIFAQRVLPQQAVTKPVPSLESNTLTRNAGNSDVLVYTDAQGRIAFMSDNALRLIKAQDKARFIGTPLKHALGLSTEAQNALMSEIVYLGYVRSRPFRITTPDGATIQSTLTAAASQNEGKFSGADIVLRVNTEEETDPETVTMAQQIYLRAGVRHTENLQVAKDYVQARILMLYSLISRLNGENVARSMVNLFNQTAQEHQWDYVMHGDRIIFPDNESEEQLAKSLPALVRVATRYTESVAGYQTVETEINIMESKMQASALRIIDSFGVR